MIKVIIQHESDLYDVAVVDGATLTRAFDGVPSVFKFKVYKDNILNFTEGDIVTVFYNDAVCFKGYVFEKSRNSDEFISVTAYDQLRYLKNKFVYVFKDYTATDVIKVVCSDYNLKVSDKIADTKHKIKVHVSDNKTLIDLIHFYLYSTQIATKVLYELYDNNGEIALQNIEDMKIDYLLDFDVISDYSYKSSIDKDTYNAVALIQNEKGKGNDAKRKYAFKSDKAHIKQWGLLRYFEKVDDKEDINAKAEKLLKLKNRKTRTLSIKNALGDIRVRGGTSIVCHLNLGDVNLSNYMVVKKVTHKFSNDEYFMDLELIGDGIGE